MTPTTYIIEVPGSRFWGTLLSVWGYIIADRFHRGSRFRVLLRSGTRQGVERASELSQRSAGPGVVLVILMDAAHREAAKH